MRVYGFQTQKGGEGKTTLTGNVGYEISQSKRTVIVDADAQGNLTSWFFAPEIWGHSDTLENELIDVIEGRATVEETLIPLTDSLLLLPTAGGKGGELNEYKEQNRAANNPLVFLDINDQLEELGFEIAIYDCSPSFDLHTKTVMVGCHEIIPPMMLEYFSMDGIESFSDGIEKTNKGFRADIQFQRLVINGHDKRYDHHKRGIGIITEDWSRKLEIHTIPTDANIRKCVWEHKPLSMFDGTSRSLVSIRSLAEAMIMDVE